MLKPGRFLRIGGRREGSMIVRVYQFAARMDRAVTDFTLTIVASQSLCTSLPTIAVTSRWLRSRLCAIPI
jgi:hypothetical protein